MALFRNYGRVRWAQLRQLHQDAPKVRIVEVGPRDGLQNEPVMIPSDVKINLVNKLTEAGLPSIEVTSFVSPKWVPQMSDNAKVFTSIKKKEGVDYPVLVPNMKGLEAALLAGVKEIAVFVSASEAFSKKNLNCSIQESLKRTKDVTESAQKRGLKIRGYISCVVGCPYEGHVKPSNVTKVSEALFDLGCYEVSLGDTIGTGTRNSTEAMMKDLLKMTSADKFAIHCHDTYGQALVNTCVALDHGVRVVDSSVSGLGGCPYAKGATGNASTEDLVYMLHGMGMETGVDLKKLVAAGRYISDYIKKPTASRANTALYSKYF